VGFVVDQIDPFRFGLVLWIRHFLPHDMCAFVLNDKGPEKDPLSAPSKELGSWAQKLCDEIAICDHRMVVNVTAGGLVKGCTSSKLVNTEVIRWLGGIELQQLPYMARCLLPCFYLAHLEDSSHSLGLILRTVWNDVLIWE
jgi:hypothetical protein